MRKELEDIVVQNKAEIKHLDQVLEDRDYFFKFKEGLSSKEILELKQRTEICKRRWDLFIGIFL